MADDDFVKALPPDGRLEYRHSWLPESLADQTFRRLRAEVAWESREIVLFGRRVLQPRLIAFQGDAGVDYTYSGDRHRAGEWHPAVADLRDRVASACGEPFNCVLMNLYRNGADSMGWHADDERELGERPVIASVSLGAPRRFQLRFRERREQRFEVETGHGSLIVMRGDLQRHWQHQVPKTARPVGPRINLTFRRILPERHPAPRRP